MNIQNSLLSLTDQVQLLVNALADEQDHVPVVKLFLPDGAATWLITEVDPDDPDRLFGLCDLGLGFPELGFVSLAEISSVKGRLGLHVERDAHFVTDKPLSHFVEEARINGKIIA
ncbi:MAG: DUF2958 domain-containing protein [Bradyrhizobiaceae bacterium]|nr:MAG: DUF2958 domain-containing protein [Bradyrhizobiaceae bacterium]